MKYIYLICSLLLSYFHSYSQSGIFLDEDQLLEAGADIVPDQTAFEEKALMRSSNVTSPSTIFYGPYTSYKAGDYLVQIRLKVSSNASTSQICLLDVYSNVGAKVYASLGLTPSMFKNSNEWQVFTLPVHITQDVPDLEFRGMEFASGICSLYVDYINVISPNALIINGNGNVGIGTTDTKGYKFAVNGNAIFTGVKVKAYSNWPDYVFHTSYRLRPLSEVEQYIKKHHHLPEVPSAAEVEKNGLDLGDNQAALLRKIEELTLYVIEQEKNQKTLTQKLQTIDLRINELRIENERLKKRLKHVSQSGK